MATTTPDGEPELRSIHELPLEPGGRIARQGFDFQDHVAAAICLDMLETGEIIEVWCESQDDITLLLDANSHSTVEFVQVKGADMDSRWSVAELTRRKGKRPRQKPSVLEQSLARAACKERVRFRVVTYTDVTPDLAALKHKLGSAGRDPEKIAALQDKIAKKRFLASPNGTTPAQWIENCLWERRESTDSQEVSNKFRLESLIKKRFGYLVAVDHLNSIYTKLLEEVKAAATRDLEKYPEAFKLRRTVMEAWLKETVDQVLFNLNVPGQSRMREKMARCQIPPDTIEKAVHLRFTYLDDRLRAGYSTVTPLRNMERLVLARLHLEKTALDAGSISETGVQFHSRCLRALEEIREGWKDSASRPDSALFQGYMYELTNRCQHRFDVVAV